MPFDALIRTSLSLAMVMALLTGFVWLARRGGFRRATGTPIVVETATGPPIPAGTVWCRPMLWC